MKTTRLLNAPPGNSDAAWAAFLRGINVGGHALVSMQKLKLAFEALGFRDVRTLLASGNVVFHAPPGTAAELTDQIQARLKQVFGFAISVQLRKIADLRRLEELAPFKTINVTPQTRLYVTFLPKKPRKPGNLLGPDSRTGFRVLQVTEREVFSVLTLTKGTKTVQLMAVLEKEFGKEITTRNWNTIRKVLEIE